MDKIRPEDQLAKSADIVSENIAQLQSLFPEVFVEGKIDFEVFKQLLGEAVEEREEKYGLNWHGKRAARQLALTPSMGTLRPCPEESVDWDSTRNLMIEGDNLEVLKILQKSYAGKVKLIYIDPPYNTGNDFVYSDDFHDSIENYQIKMGLRDKEGQRVSSLAKNSISSGRFHTEWISMMYSRLIVARNLLSDDGAIFVSIDDNEVHHLRTMMSEIFGDENFSATIIWEKSDSPRNSARQFSEDHDYLVVFSRDPSWAPDRLPRTEAANSIYTNPDNDHRGSWLPGDPYANKPYSKGRYVIVGPTGRNFSPPHGRYWRISEEKFRELDADGRIWWGPTGDARPSIKRYLTEVSDLTPRTLWKKEDVGSNRTSKNELRSLFPESESFDTPKPIKLMERVLQLSTEQKSDDIVLDFFSGSGTMAHATMDLNSSDGGARRFIMVQLPEPLNGESSKVFSSVAEITKERLRRAGKKIREQNPMFAGDTGFRVFKLDSSNIRAWNPDRDNLSQSLMDHIEHILPGRTEADILYEVLLKLGLDLCVPMEKRVFTGKDVHAIGGGVLMACLSTNISRDDVEALGLGVVAWLKELAPAGESTVVFRDNGFADDVAKTNLTAILHQNGLTNVRSL